MYGIDDEELREELRRIDTANKEIKDGKVYAKFNRILTLVGHNYNVKHLIDKEDI